MGIRDWWSKRGSEAPGAGTQASRPAAEGKASPPPVVGTQEDTAGLARRVASRVVSPGLTVHEYHHTFKTSRGSLPVRTFLTEGLLAHHAHEVRLTVPASWSQSAVDAATEWLHLQERFAAEGRASRLGGFTAVRHSNGQRLCVVYGRGDPIAGIDGAEAAIVAVRVLDEEMAVAQQGLGQRVLGALAARSGIFPYPAVWDSRTEPVFTPQEQAASKLEILPRTQLGDTHVSRIGGVVRVSLPAAADRELTEALAPRPGLKSLAILAQLAPDADGQMLWRPGVEQPMAATVYGQRPQCMGYTFVALLEVPETMVSYLEDGILLGLAPGDFERTLGALTSGRDLVQSLDGIEVRIEFRANDPLAP